MMLLIFIVTMNNGENEEYDDYDDDVETDDYGDVCVNAVVLI